MRLPRMLAAGDHFVRPQLLTAALRAELAAGRDAPAGPGTAPGPGPAGEPGAARPAGASSVPAASADGDGRSGVATTIREITDIAEITELTLPWPYEPFGRVAEVNEASGDEATLAKAAAEVEVVLTQMAPFTERVLDAARRLRLIACCRGGPVNINLPAATARGIMVCYAPGRNAAAAAEHTVGLILAALRRIPQTHAELHAGNWAGENYAYENCGGELAGSTAGLVGYGAIGRRVAAVLRAFGAEVLAADPYADPSAVDSEVTLVPLPELLRRSRVVSLHARLTAETTGLIGAEELALMPPGAVLVNTARGGLLDYGALADALESGRLRAAGLDVYDEEPPPPGSRLLRLPGVVTTPHLGGATRQTAERAARIAAAAVARYIRGEPPRNVANPEVLR
jgi:D-3-phosphoglycerate dehydrogenase